MSASEGRKAAIVGEWSGEDTRRKPTITSRIGRVLKNVAGGSARGRPEQRWLDLEQIDDKKEVGCKRSVHSAGREDL